MFVLAVSSLSRVCNKNAPAPTGEQNFGRFNRDDYSSEQGNGVWIPAYLRYIESLVRDHTHRPFTFSGYEELSPRAINEIPNTYIRNLVMRFTASFYVPWSEHDVYVPEYEEVRPDCRDFCDGCDTGFSSVYATYEGPLAEDVEADESTAQLGLSAGEMIDLVVRNEARHEERERRRRRQESIEEQVVSTEFTCDEDCDDFVDHVNEEVVNRTDTNLGALREYWRRFAATNGASGDRLPPLHPPRPQPATPRRAS